MQFFGRKLQLFTLRVETANRVYFSAYIIHRFYKVADSEIDNILLFLGAIETTTGIRTKIETKSVIGQKVIERDNQQTRSGKEIV